MSVSMSNDNTEQRLDFMGIDAETKETLREMRPMLEVALPQVLTGFYQVVKKWPNTNNFFKNEGHMDMAKNAQIKHWMSIIEGSFSQNYVSSVRKIGETHARIGLEPRWYIGGYAYIVSEVEKLIIAQTEVKGLMANNTEAVAKAQRQVSAFTKAAMLDMDFAISIYLEASEAKRHEVLHNIANAFDASVAKIVESVASASTELSVTARSMSSIAEATSSRATTVAAAAEEATSNVSVVAASTEEMSSSVKEIAQQVSTSTRVAGQAVILANESAATVHNLSQAADKIGEVVSMISDIAGQTNLLALNATIESARAGEAGKGFAVVASEVKSLAGQTAKATEDISRQINEMQNATRSAVEAISSIQRTIDEINSVSMAINAAVEEQSAATSEITRNTQEASIGTQDVSRNITHVQQGANETGAAASEVVTAAEELSRQAEVLRAEVQGFLNNIKAA